MLNKMLPVPTAVIPKRPRTVARWMTSVIRTDKGSFDMGRKRWRRIFEYRGASRARLVTMGRCADARELMHHMP